MNETEKFLQNNANEIIKLISQGIEEFVYNFSRLYDYEKVFVFAVGVKSIAEIDFYVGVEYDLLCLAKKRKESDFKKILQQDKIQDHYRYEAWEEYYWFYQHLTEFYYSNDMLFAPQFKKNWYKLLREFIYKDEDVDLYTFLLRYVKEALIATEAKGVLKNLSTAPYYFEIIVKYTYENEYIIEKTQSYPYHLKSLPNFNSKISLPHNTLLEQAIYNNIENQENWLLYGDWLQTQGDSRGEIIYLSISYQKKYPKHSLRDLNTLLKHPFFWPEEDKPLLQRLETLLRQKWQFLCMDITADLLRIVGVDWYVRWQYGFIYYLSNNIMDNRYYYDSKLYFQLLLSEAACFVHTLSFGFTTFSLLYEFLSFKQYYSVRALYLAAYDEARKTQYDLQLLDQHFPHLEYLDLDNISISTLIHSHLSSLNIDIHYFPKKIFLPKLHTMKLQGFYDLDIEDSLIYFKQDFTKENFPQLQKIEINYSIKDYNVLKLLNSFAIMKEIQCLKISVASKNAQPYEENKTAVECIKILKQWRNLKKIIIKGGREKEQQFFEKALGKNIVVECTRTRKIFEY